MSHFRIKGPVKEIYWLTEDQTKICYQRGELDNYIECDHKMQEAFGRGKGPRKMIGFRKKTAEELQDDFLKKQAAPSFQNV